MNDKILNLEFGLTYKRSGHRKPYRNFFLIFLNKFNKLNKLLNELLRFLP